MSGLQRLIVESRRSADLICRSPARFWIRGDIYFLMHEGSQEFLSSVGPNETVPRKIDPDPANSSLFRRTATGDSWVAIQGML